MSGRIDLDRIAFIGRTYREYRNIFGLDDGALRRGRILDCPAGASSFAGEGREKGHDVTACDLLYSLPPDELVRKARADTDYALRQAYKVREMYDWGFYGGVEGHRAEREKALLLFAGDFTAGLKEGRYVPARLPALPFKDGSFSLVLSGHFLFLYGDRLDFDFHLQSLIELARVGGEVRVFPTVGLEGGPYPGLDRLIEYLKQAHVCAEVVKTPFEFMKGADRMLKLTRLDK